MGRKTPPFPNYPQWTVARFWGFIRSALRSAWSKYPVKYEALKQARKPNNGHFDSRTKWVFECNNCKEVFKQKDVQVDHIVSAGTLRDYDDLPDFVRKLFCSVDDLQILCKECHKVKTKEERSKSNAN